MKVKKLVAVSSLQLSPINIEKLQRRCVFSKLYYYFTTLGIILLSVDSKIFEQVPVRRLIPTLYKAQDGCVISVLDDDSVVLGGTFMGVQGEEFRAEKAALW